jgi:hypothetical protein
MIFMHTDSVQPIRSRVLPKKLKRAQLIKKFLTFYQTQRFITVFTTARQLSLSWTRSNQSILPHPTSCRSILILSYHLCLSLQSGLLPSRLPTKTCMHLFVPIRATLPTHLILIDLITQITLGEKYTAKCYSYSLHHYPVTSSFLDPNILLSIVFSNRPTPSAHVPSSMWQYKP